MDLLIVKCPLCDDLIRLVNCTHTHPDCPWRSPLMPLGWILPVTHDIIPTATVSADKSSDTETSESDKDGTDKPTKKRKWQKKKNADKDNCQFNTLTHRCPVIKDLRSKPTARKSVPKWLRSELNKLTSEPIPTLSDRSDKLLPKERLVDILELMINQMERVDVQMCCHRLIDQYSSFQFYWELKAPLKRSLVEVVLSVMKHHCHDSLIVKNFGDLLVEKIAVDEDKIDLYLGPIDWLLEIFGDETKLAMTARMSALKLLQKIASKSDVDQKKLIGQKLFVENICQSIKHQLSKEEYDDDLMKESWECLRSVCWRSAVNMKRFSNAGGINLAHKCSCNSNNSQTGMVQIGIRLMLDMSGEKSLGPELIAAENLKFLWKVWNDCEKGQLSYECSLLFRSFVEDSQVNWPSDHPKYSEVKRKLSKQPPPRRSGIPTGPGVMRKSAALRKVKKI